MRRVRSPFLSAWSQRKGQTWQVEEMMKLFLVIIVFAGAVLIFVASSGGLTGVLQEFCLKNPEWCGDSAAVNEDYEVVKESVEALICAVNSVVEGKESESSVCQRYFQEPDIGDDTETPDSADIPLVGGTGSVSEKVSLAESDVYVSCTDPTTCRVHNFQLPQDTANQEEWIKGFGDPNILVYWQSFPEGEDEAWSSQALWMENAFDVVVSWWGAGKFLSIGKGAASASVKYAFFRGGSQLLKSSERLTFSKFLGHVMKHESGSLGTAMKKIGSEALTSYTPQQLSLAAKRLGTKAAAITPIMAGAAVFDSYSRKYDQFPDSIVVKIPFEDPDNRPTSLNGEPVFLHDKEIGFYLASPCDALLTVERKLVECEDGFAYNLYTKALKCLDPEFKDFGPIGGRQECIRELDIKKYFSENDPSVPNAISNLDSKEKLRFFTISDDLSMIMIRDPVGRIRFIIQKGVIDSPVDVSSGVNPDPSETQIGWEVTNIIFEHEDGTSRSFNVVDGKIEEDDFEANIAEDYTFNSYMDIVMDATWAEFYWITDLFEIDKATCELCEDYKVRIENIKGLKFHIDSEKIAESGDEEKIIRPSSLMINYKSGYDVYFFDMGDKIVENKADISVPDGIAELVTITEGGVFSDVKNFFNEFWTWFPHDVAVKDIDFDGIMDEISYNKSCYIPGVTVDLLERKETGKPNFCYAEESLTRETMRWAPEIGTVLGGTAGLLGGPFAEVSVPGGAIIGQRVGAMLFTAYIVKEKYTGSEAIWPGKESG